MNAKIPHRRPTIPQLDTKHLTPISKASVSSVFTESNPSTPRSIIMNFLQVVHYRRPAYLRSKELQQALRDEVLSWGLDIPNWDAIIPPSCAMAEMSYSGHSFEQKLLISLFTWFMIYVDDKAAREDPTPFSVFQQRYLASEKQLDPVMDRFAIHLRDMWKHYPAFSANAIVSSAFEFVNGCYLERLTEGMTINPNASRYPYFLRSKTGVAHAYAFLIFPSAQHPNITSYIQAAPSVAYFIDIVNDILSFHKEELAHETENYVHLRAVVTNRKDPLVVVNDLVEEAITSADGIGATLTSEAKEAWIRFKIGYITFHVSQERYRLSDLGLSALKTPVC